jgi:hypothetical protein
MAARVEIESGWSDLVFHVLAHADLKQIAPDLFDQRYAAWVARQPGPGGERTLEQDARTLGLVLLCRSLTHHGRVFADRIFVGLPDPCSR